jgi:hypothetical protein
MNAPAVWLHADTQSYRACEICVHGVRDGAALCCGCPAARFGGQLPPVAQARARTGACGPDALHLELPTWQAQALA